MPEHLFICGCARSGTSQATRLLTAHHEIALGQERFNKVYREHPDDVGPTLFSPERFWDLRPTDTHYETFDGKFASFYDLIRPRYDKARYVGDKSPDLFNHYELIAERLPGARFVFVSRDLPAVAASYVARAEDPEAPWPESRRVAAAINDWCMSHSATAAVQASLPVFVVRFESLVSGTGLDGLLGFLDLGPDAGVMEALADTKSTAHELSDARVRRPDGFTNEERDRLARALDGRGPKRRRWWRRSAVRADRASLAAASMVHETAAAQGRLW